MNEDDPIATAIGAIVKAGDLAGAAAMVWCDAKMVQIAAVGWRVGVKRSGLGNARCRSSALSSSL